MNVNDYSVRYESDRDVTVVHFVAPQGTPAETIVLMGAGMLFLGDCCPGERFCVYRNDDRENPVIPETATHHYYGDDDRLWGDVTSEYPFDLG